MSKFLVNFEIKGIGEVVLPVTPLDDLIVLVNGLEQKVFRFNIANTLGRAVSFAVTSTVTGAAASKVSVVLPSQLTLDVDQVVTVEASIVPVTALVEGDAIAVSVLGTEV